MIVIPDKFRLATLLAACVLTFPVLADPWVGPGDLSFRHDIQRLADAGVIKSPVTAWPIPWATIAYDLDQAGTPDSRDPDVLVALSRVTAKLTQIRRARGLQPGARVSAASDPFWLRTFEDTPRDEAGVGAGVSWTGNRFAVRLQGSYTSDPDDDQEWRMDGSYASMVLGNHIISAGAIDRWWGPGHENTLIYSSNARPLGAFSLERNVAMPFENKWLSWVGPWNYAFSWGFLGDDRVVSDSRFLAFRGTFRPTSKLEIGISRTAIWCGTGRPCDADALWDIVKGDDNAGEGGITRANDPSNQSAAFDIRWQSPIGDAPYALYTQWMANDEVNGFPSEWTAQGGIEYWGTMDWRWLQGSYRAHLEGTTTIADFYEGEPNYDRTYNHNTYTTGYRYKGRSLGAAADGDSIVVSAGLLLVEDTGSSWNALARWSNINRQGNGLNQDLFHAVSADELKVIGVQLSRKQSIEYGEWKLGSVAIGLGYEHTENEVSGGNDDDVHAFLQWSWDIQDN